MIKPERFIRILIIIIFIGTPTLMLWADLLIDIGISIVEKLPF